MWIYASLDAAGIQAGSARRRCPVASWILLAALTGSWCADAQLVTENPRQRWRPGEVVELLLRERDIRQAVEINAVLFDEEPIPFELVAPERADDPIRIRITVPAGIGPGAHSVSVLSSPARTGVPEVVGLTLAQAQQTLTAQGLELDTGALRAGASKAAVHRVVRQDPAAGTRVPSGSRVTVVVASETTVPDIVSLKLGAARRLLAEHGLELEAPAGGAAAVIWTQEPEAGTPAPLGSPIAVEIAYPTPNLLGRRLEAVRPELLASVLVPLVDVLDPDDGPYETVLSQTPAAGQLVPAGTEVRLSIQSRPDPPGPRWPWPWLAATAGLTAGLGARIRARRAASRSYRIEAHSDRDRLFESVTEPAREDTGRGLDIRLVGHPDPGQQSFSTDGPLVGEPVR